jgi:zinc protease
MPVDPKITMGKLDNGLRYYIRPNQRPQNRAWLYLAVNAGSVLEDEDQLGLAHFVEHMGFNGTKHFPGNSLIDYLETKGVIFGYEANAYTSFDETVYTLRVPTDSVAVVEEAFQILEDWAHLVSFDSTEVDKERGVVVEEWRVGLGARKRMLNEQLPILFKNSRYAERLPIGKKNVIDTFEHETLTRFYRDWYRPDLMAVIAVGDFDERWIKSMIEKHFAGIPMPANPRERRLFEVPDHGETLFALASDPEAMWTMVGLYYKRDVRSKSTVGDYRDKLVSRLYNVMLNYRLMELKRSPNPPFLSARSGEGRFVKSKDVYVISASVDETGIERGLEALLTEAQRVKTYGFGEKELERAKSRILRMSEKFADEDDKIMSRLMAGKCLLNFTRNEPLPGFANEFELHKQLLPGIRLEDVNQLIGDLMRDGNLVVFSRAPEKEGLELPSEDALLALFDAVKDKEIEDYVDTFADEPLIDEILTPGKIVSEKTIDEVGVTEWTLSNGVRVVLKPTDFYNDRISFRCLSPGGTSLVPDSRYASAVVAGGIVRASGIGDFSKDELRKKLSDKIAVVYTDISRLTEGLSGGGSTKDIETLFELIYLHMTSPRRDEEVFESYLSRWKSRRKNEGASPEAVFADTVDATLAQYHPRALRLPVEAIDGIDLDDALDIYADRFADASDFVFIFLGNFELDQMRSLVETYLGSLPALHQKETWKDPGITPPRGVIKKTVRKGMEPKSRVVLVFTGPCEWSRENEYRLQATAKVMRIRLREVLREDLSGTYGASCWAACDLYPKPEYRFRIGFGCDPDRVEELIGVVFAEIDSLRTRGPDESYVIKVRETDRRSYEKRLEMNGFWERSLWECYFRGEDPKVILDLARFIETLSADSIRESARRYLDTNHYVQVVLLPE